MENIDSQIEKVDAQIKELMKKKNSLEERKKSVVTMSELSEIYEIILRKIDELPRLSEVFEYSFTPQGLCMTPIRELRCHTVSNDSGTIEKTVDEIILENFCPYLSTPNLDKETVEITVPTVEIEQ